MASPEVRALSLLYNGQKFGECFDFEVDINGARVALFGSEGYFAHAKGAVHTSITMQHVIPVGGATAQKVIDTVAQNPIAIGWQNGSKSYQLEMAITNCRMRSNTETGRAEGTLTLEGGAPTDQGTVITFND